MECPSSRNLHTVLSSLSGLFAGVTRLSLFEPSPKCVLAVSKHFFAEALPIGEHFRAGVTRLFSFALSPKCVLAVSKHSFAEALPIGEHFRAGVTRLLREP